MNIRNLLLLASWVITVSCQPNTENHSQSRIVFDTLEGRPLQIYLPAGYNPNQVYPVVYMHDGQNIFLDSTSFAGEWGADEVMDSLINIGAMPPTLIVGIYNSPRRAEEYVPYNDESILEMMNMDHWDGSTHMLFADFMIYDLFPFIEKKYQASNQSSDRALIGSSFGAVQAFWMGLNYSEFFNMIGALSPSVWVDQGAMIREVHSYEKLPNINMWLDIGSEEYDPRSSLLVQNLHQKGLTYGKQLWYYEELGAHHHESSWRKRLASPLLLFKGLKEYQQESVNAEHFVSKNNDTTYHKTNLTLSLSNGVKYTAMHLAEYTSSDVALDSVGHILSQPAGEVLIKFEESNYEVILP